MDEKWFQWLSTKWKSLYTGSPKGRRLSSMPSLQHSKKQNKTKQIKRVLYIKYSFFRVTVCILSAVQKLDIMSLLFLRKLFLTIANYFYYYYYYCNFAKQMGIFICPSSKISWAFECLLHEVITINQIGRQWVQLHRHYADLTASPALVSHLPSPGSDVCCSWCTHTLFEQRFYPCQMHLRCPKTYCVSSSPRSQKWWENMAKKVRQFRRQKKMQINKV